MASLFDEPKIDTHCHLLDPARFPYAADVLYRPTGQEVGDQTSFEYLMESYGVRHALLVGPNSGYNLDNRCMLHAIGTGAGRFKGIAVVPTDASLEALAELKSQGIVGIAFNVALNGLPYYAAHLKTILHKLEELDLWAQFQVEADQLLELLPYLEGTRVRLLFDHCGRPVASKGTEQAGFQALLELGREGRAVVKLSGEVKFSNQGFPFADARPYWDALIDAFGLSRCLWASDWPYLKAPFRLDYGPMLKRWETYLSAPERQKLMWDNPKRMFNF
jgi:predicted TIM-barrel fold metal-dependent hydrolase